MIQCSFSYLVSFPLLQLILAIFDRIFAFWNQWIAKLIKKKSNRKTSLGLMWNILDTTQFLKCLVEFPCEQQI